MGKQLPVSPLCKACDYGMVASFIGNERKALESSTASTVNDGKREVLDLVAKSGAHETKRFEWPCGCCKLLALHRAVQQSEKAAPVAFPVDMGRQIMITRVKSFLTELAAVIREKESRHRKVRESLAKKSQEP
jgi:hypothetical protein